MGDMSGDHQSNSVSERQSNVKDPGNNVLVDNMRRSIQPGVRNQRHSDIRSNADQCWDDGQVLVLTSLDHMLEAAFN